MVVGQGDWAAVSCGQMASDLQASSIRATEMALDLLIVDFSIHYDKAINHRANENTICAQ
jgi:hypothetical protein